MTVSGNNPIFTTSITPPRKALRAKSFAAFKIIFKVICRTLKNNLPSAQKNAAAAVLHTNLKAIIYNG